jgi:hypothetical protein
MTIQAIGFHDRAGQYRYRMTWPRETGRRVSPECDTDFSLSVVSEHYVGEYDHMRPNTYEAGEGNGTPAFTFAAPLPAVFSAGTAKGGSGAAAKSLRRISLPVLG